MKKLSPKMVSLAWLAIIAVAFFVGRALQIAEPDSVAEPLNASPATVNEPADSPAQGLPTQGSPETATERTPAPSAGPEGTPRATVAPEMVAQRIRFVLQDLANLEASEKAQMEQYRDELKALVKNVTAENAPGIAEKFLGKYATYQTDSALAPAFDEFYRAWGALAGADAMAFDQKHNVGAAEKIIEGWAKSDPEAAKAYAAKMSNNEYRGGMTTRSVVTTLAETNLDDAIAFSSQYESVGGGSSADKLSKKIFEQRGVQGIEKWFARVEEILGSSGPSNYRNNVAKNGLLAMVEVDPAKAQKWILEFAGRGFIDADTMKQIVTKGKLAATPEEELSLIAMASPADAEQASGFSGALTEKFDAYLKRDFKAAGAWLASQPRDSRNDGAIQKFALAAASADREAALEWVQQISDPRLREETLAKPEFSGKPAMVRPQKR